MRIGENDVLLKNTTRVEIIITTSIAICIMNNRNFGSGVRTISYINVIIISTRAHF